MNPFIYQYIQTEFDEIRLAAATGDFHEIDEALGRIESVLSNHKLIEFIFDRMVFMDGEDFFEGDFDEE